MTPEATGHLDKARECLSRGRIILAAGVAEDAARNAYLAAFHAAQALIAERTGKDAKTHRGAHVAFARLSTDEPRIDLELRRFLPQSFNMKAVADYELGPDAVVPTEQPPPRSRRQPVSSPASPNCCHREFDASTPAIDDILRRFRSALDQIYGDPIERVVLYGSRARSDARPDSDYDIAVFIKNPDALSMKADWLVDVETDILDDTGAVINSMPYRAGSYAEWTSLMQEVRREGVDL